MWAVGERYRSVQQQMTKYHKYTGCLTETALWVQKLTESSCDLIAVKKKTNFSWASYLFG